MKSFTIGCVSIVAGVLLGAVLVLLALPFVNIGGSWQCYCRTAGGDRSGGHLGSS